MTAQVPRRRAAGILAATAVAALALAGCSSGGGRTESAVPGAGDNAVKEADLSGGQGGAVGAPSGAEQPGDPQQAPNKVEPQQRSIIYTGTMSVRVDNVQEAADKAISIATGFGGLVGGDRRTLNDDRSEAQLTLRVPADKFTATLDALARELGKEESRGIQTQDVTETVLDLDVRLASQQASVDRVRVLLARAQTIGEIVSIESELTRREAELASLKQRKDRVSDLVALSTITVTLRGPSAPTPPDGDETGFLAGLKNGWTGFLASVKVVLTVFGWLLPWVIAIGVPAWLIVWLLRRRRGPLLGPAAATCRRHTACHLPHHPRTSPPRPDPPPRRRSRAKRRESISNHAAFP